MPTTSSSCSRAIATPRSCTTWKGRSLTGARSDLEALLAAHRLAGARETPLQNAGYSGAAIARLTRDDGAPFVLKRMSIHRDWIMRATDDDRCREAAFARTPSPLPAGVAHPALGATRDGDAYALLMRDITPALLPEMIDGEATDAILRAMAALHGVPASALPPLPWCALDKRLALLTPQTARIASAYGAPVAADIMHGWSLFARHAPPAVDAALRALFEDRQPLLDALKPLPPMLLHGDLKFDNIGIDADGTVWLIDWAMTLVAPAAVDLGWFLAINSRRMTISLDETLARYAHFASLPADLCERHDAATVLCGLLLRGWRKALDAEGGEPGELRWWCARAEAALRYL